MSNAPINRIAKMALNVALISCLFGQSLALPAMAQYSLQAEQDSFLPPEVVPLDPAVAKKMSQAQAQARQESANNSNSYGQNSAMSGYPAGSNDASMNNFNNQNSQPNQGMMNNMMSQNGMNSNGMNQGQPNFNSSMGGQEVPGNTGTSDWIMPGQDQNSPMTAYGNVNQTQTLSAPPANPIVRRTTRRGGMGTAVSALAGFGAGAMVGTMIRRPNSLYGLGATGLMMTGFGTRNAFRF